MSEELKDAIETVEAVNDEIYNIFQKAEELMEESNVPDYAWLEDGDGEITLDKDVAHETIDDLDISLIDDGLDEIIRMAQEAKQELHEIQRFRNPYMM